MSGAFLRLSQIKACFYSLFPVDMGCVKYLLPVVCIMPPFFITFAFKQFVAMNNISVDLFFPLLTDSFDAASLRSFVSAGFGGSVYLAQREENAAVAVEGVVAMPVTSFVSTAFFKQMAAAASAEFVIYFSKGVPQVEMAHLADFCRAVPADASMAYADYYKIVNGEKSEAPTIDYQEGSLRNDFDFGSVLLFRTSALKKYLLGCGEEFTYAGLYQLRLAMSREGNIFHYKKYLYAECENDNRKSGEKQFDYVNPAQRDVQIEMEAACSTHLKAVGAYLPACKYGDIELSQGDFAVEASVVIPVLNRASTIADAIGSVLTQRTSFPFNIIVVDNHSTDGTSQIIDGFGDDRVVHIIPSRTDLGIGGCWNEAVNSPLCGRFAVQLDSDDLYSSENTLQQIVDEFYKQRCAMLIGSYRICDFDLNTLPPGVIDHREWSEENGRNNALRINGLGAPRAFYTPVIRETGFPNVSYGEDYAVGLQLSRSYRIGRIYDVLYLCRRWGGNSDAALSHEKVNAHNIYKDSLRTAELLARREIVKSISIPAPEALDDFFAAQLAQWPEADERFKALEGVQTRRLENGIILQHNPARIVSSAAKVDGASVSERPCFLCAKNRPSQQTELNAMGSLSVLVNPYPILPSHLTLPLKEHTPQLLRGLYADALHLARMWQGRALFYNGAKCGASAPDHAHLQSVRVCDVPLLNEVWADAVADTMEPLTMSPEGSLYKVTGYVVPFFMIVTKNVSASVLLMEKLTAALPVACGEAEPMMNVFVYHSPAEGYVTVVLPRAKHRPSCYFAEGEAQRLVSPGALDMAGLVITARGEDFEKITADEALAMLREVAADAEDFENICENFDLL